MHPKKNSGYDFGRLRLFEHTVLQYWMNNGTVEIENPFEKLLNYTPYCDPQFHFVEMSLNYKYAPPVDITSPLKKGNDKLL